MSTLVSKIQSLLLGSAKPLSFKDLAKALGVEIGEIEQTIEQMQATYNSADSGIHLLINNNQVQFTTNPDHVALVESFLNTETTGELSKPSLETLTIIAYRQPITKEALEQIRGINCSLILRNLLIRGLVEAKEIKGGLSTEYSVTMDFLRFLGVNRVEELPNFETLHAHENIEAVLQSAEGKDDAAG